MRYIDSGNRDPKQALGSWLSAQASAGLEEIRVQSGYFSIDGLGLLTRELQTMSTHDKVVRMVIGSNSGKTLGQDVQDLITLLKMPRKRAEVALVWFGNALFHPKVYHLIRRDGSQAAYVGSANLGFSGVAGLNVEAGLLLDEKDGDDVAVLGKIKAAVDAWFTKTRPSCTHVADSTAVGALLASGRLAKARPPRTAGAGGGGPASVKLAPLINMPKVTIAALSRKAGATAPTSPSVHMTGYPSQMWLVPNAQTPTSGVGALSGVPLPNSAVGLVLRLSKDTVRPWTGKVGTANLPQPIDTLEPLRFGRNKSGKPRAEFELWSRVASSGGINRVADTKSNIMAYGYGPQPTGHKDVRMLLPKKASDLLAEATKTAKLPLPAAGDYALLEWPDSVSPSYKLTIMDVSTSLYGDALALMAKATQDGELVGGSACWLPAGVSPAW